ncbi:BLOC-1-related complex subunit 6 isoform X2 [Thalassophryne amazonica]|uniref:BLOC-1-related complex subunit 6 isoform X1 n=1 Tax=Thalassophryne amazonica TaxID=390379 RepID=UPI0014708ADD|nr:BLOC-1-related complex subunit 6 isoform X1 [Thalassophryne amazonica]XP_034027638.1 BLOC-1-related complex subunit 6 isoform X2 [Thalassophryne amazonica]
MSLSTVIGTDVPDIANGIVTPLSLENGPHVPVGVKLGHSRVCCDVEASGDASFGQTEEKRDMESRVYMGEVQLDTETDINDRTSSLSLHTLHVTNTGDSKSKGMDSPVEPPDTALPWDSVHHTPPKYSSQGGDLSTAGRQQAEKQTVDGGTDKQEEGEKEKQDEEDDEKNEMKWRTQHAGERTEAESSQQYSSSAPGPSTPSSSSPPPPLLPSDDAPCPPHVMAQVWVRNVRGMQDSKSLDEISQACGGGLGARGGARGGQSEGRRATISSALELEGTVSHDGDLTNFITKNLEQKIKMSSKPSLDCSDSDCSGPIYRSQGLSRRPADIPPIDPAVLVDLQRHTQEVAHSVEMMMRSLNGTIQNMTALSVGYIQTYRDSVDSLGESVDMSIKGMYTLMARCEELDRSMQPIHTLAAQIREIKRTLDVLEAICK